MRTPRGYRRRAATLDVVPVTSQRVDHPGYLSAPEWQTRAVAHAERVDRLVAGHRARRRRGENHPVEDFLFTYYSFRPGQLRRWHPGAGIILGGEAARAYLRHRDYRAHPRGVLLAEAAISRRFETVRWVCSLLRATAQRPAFFGCLGLHEWAMVYRLGPDEMRHARWPLRLGADGTNHVVETHQIRCTHYDAFRFFTTAARPRNALEPTRERQADFEQGGCLHANMDLYKWAYKLSPLVPSELVADAFELARDIRLLDMRASPYDLTALGYEPVPIETPEGKADYTRQQRGFAARAATLRARLLAALDAFPTTP